MKFEVKNQVPIPIEDILQTDQIGGFNIDRNFTKILFKSNKLGTPHLFLSPLNMESEPRILTQGLDNIKNGILSPNGDYVIFLQDKDGNEIPNLYGIDLTDNSISLLSDKNYRDGGVSFHPNSKIVYRSMLTGATGVIEQINVQTGENSFFKKDLPFLPSEMEFSHNQKWIATTALTGRASSDLYFINCLNPEETLHKSLSKTSFELGPMWSPDDKKIAFMSNSSGKGRIYIHKFRSDEFFMLPLESSEFAALDPPLWHPDGNSLYYIIIKDGLPLLQFCRNQLQVLT